MYIVKFSVSTQEHELIDFIRAEMEDDYEINAISSKGLLGTEGVDIAIVGQITGICSAIAYTIDKFLKRNKGKSIAIENSKGKRTYNGYSIDEIKEIESFISEDMKEVN